MPEIKLNEELYAQAEALQADSTGSLIKMAVLAWGHRKSKSDLRQLSFQWQRDARRMARAVERWPDWFIGDSVNQARITEVDDAITLFALAGLPIMEAQAKYDDWRRLSWRSWQVEEAIAYGKMVRAEAAGTVKRLRVKGALVREFGKYSIVLGVPVHLPLDPALETEWYNAKVNVMLTIPA